MRDSALFLPYASKSAGMRASPLHLCVSVDVRLRLRVRACVHVGVVVHDVFAHQGTNAVGFVPLVITNLETAHVPAGGGLWQRHSCAENFTLLDQTGPASAFCVCVCVFACVAAAVVVVAAVCCRVSRYVCVLRFVCCAFAFVTGGPC